MAKQIEDDFCDDVPGFYRCFEWLFHGSSRFVKKYSHNCEVSFVKWLLMKERNLQNDVKELIGLNQNLEGRSVIIVEDIVDTGNTIEELKAIMKQHNVKHFKIATLFLKPEAYKKTLNWIM